MRISDWSSDVCSSDLDRQHGRPGASLRGRAKKGDQDAQGLGRSRGGFTTKLHARCDGQGRPLCFVLTPGQAHDVQGFGPLFRMLAERVDALLADTGYDADAIRDTLAKADAAAVIPPKDRSEERRVGKEGGNTVRTRVWQ